MIICHPLKLIFIKTKKVGGTSFEIALSRHCSDSCVITPITPKDEATRKELGFRGAQNYERPRFPDGTHSAVSFVNHAPARFIRANVPVDLWDSYRKVTIVRNPYDAMISRYYWEGGPKTGMDFDTFVFAYRIFLSENARIAPLDGPDRPDVFLNYDRLDRDIPALGIDGLWDTFKSIGAKSGLRPAGETSEKVYAAFPRAARVVAGQCQAEIAEFGFAAPTVTPARATPETPDKTDYVFTLTAGRTGSAWLAQFLEQNLARPAVHEPLRIDDFGHQMPDIRIMRAFNTFGFDRTVQDFWQNKFAALTPPYIETNHTLGKCGLIEALADSDLASRTSVIILRRDLAAQCASYIMRGDFQNITMDWQWYLSKDYRNVIVNPQNFAQLGHLGAALWYCFEMAARQAYYTRVFGNQINFIPCRLEEVTTPQGAAALLTQLGHSETPRLPARTNASRQDDDLRRNLTAEVTTLLNTFDFDAEALADQYIRAGRRLAMPPQVPRNVA